MKLSSKHLQGLAIGSLVIFLSIQTYGGIIPHTTQNGPNTPSYTKLDETGADLPDDAALWVMVRDNNTGLIWEVKAEIDGIHNMRNKYTWNAAQNSFIKELNDSKFGGASDWRLPTVTELTRICRKDVYMPSINETFFPHTYTHDYWTATPYAKDNSQAWRVHFCRGFVTEMPKQHQYYVRAVRGPKEISMPLVDNGDGTVTDPSTGLMWQQTYQKEITWDDALKQCEDLNLAGYSDWRLPNAHELQSIVDYGQSWPAADIGLLSLPQPDNMERPIPDNATDYEKKYGVDTRFCFWSSSVYASNEDNAWLVDFKAGRFYMDGKKTPMLSRAVRKAGPISSDDSLPSLPAK